MEKVEARAITLVETEIIETGENVVVHLVTLYDKADTSNVSNQYIEQVIGKITAQSGEEE